MTAALGLRHFVSRLQVCDAANREDGYIAAEVSRAPADAYLMPGPRYPEAGANEFPHKLLKKMVRLRDSKSFIKILIISHNI